MEGDETFEPSWLGSADEVFEERVADDDVLVFKVVSHFHMVEVTNCISWPST